jgi:hypothetical protein
MNKFISIALTMALACLSQTSLASIAKARVVLEDLVPVAHTSSSIGTRTRLMISGLLSESPAVTLLDREQLSSLVDERTLGQTQDNGDFAVEHEQAIAGADYLLGGSLLDDGFSQHFFGKLVDVRDGSMRAFTVSGNRYQPLETFSSRVTEKMLALIQQEQSTDKREPATEKLTKLQQLTESLAAYDKPTIAVSIDEQHIRRRVIDPAAETEFLVFGAETGFPMIDNDPRFQEYVDVMILGEGFTEVSYRNGRALGVTARLEVKAISRKTGRLLAIDRQTSVVVAGTELIGSKNALAKASAAIAMRMLPKLVGEPR